MSFKGYS
ncbi:hypothetical protein CGLO_01275 [Colletotrichum gloeosporioides Cg-14]|nr:hypothetical protein CGLO_01275 [Colletotrichum gloeosporioides Cg-14]